MTDLTPLNTDILILGAGPVGMALSLALAAGGQKSLLLDRCTQETKNADPRALALAYGTRQLLEQIKAWPERDTTPIETIHISQKNGFSHTLIDCAEYRLPALGYVVRYGELAAGLARQLPSESILDSTEILDITPSDDRVTVTFKHAGQLRTIHTKILVHADGTPDNDPDVRISDYHQHAVITEITTVSDNNTGHNKQAWERFTPDGPLALLPLGDKYSVVFTLPPARADSVMGMDDATFTAALQEQFGQHLHFARPGPRSRFPLAMKVRNTLVKGNEVWIGNSAQTLHPVAGQGFNLGLRDAWQLAETLLSNGINSLSLARYAASRRLDRAGSTLFTDLIVRTFSNDFGPLRLARGLGLLALDLCPPARHFVARRMIWGSRAWP